MIRLRLFAGTELRDGDGRPVRPVLDQPKRLALLIYLVLTSKDGPQKRDTLMAYFWPESDTPSARRALNQATHFLRRALGAEAIESRGAGDLAASLDHVWCDVLAFREAMERGDWTAALSLYRGELLPGFHVGGMPEFERWMEQERSRLRGQAREAAVRLAEGDAAVDPQAAAAWVRRALEFLPHDEELLRRLLTLLAESGNRPAALEVYREFAERLAADLELEPSAETLELVEAIRAGKVAPAGWSSASVSAGEPESVGPVGSARSEAERGASEAAGAKAEAPPVEVAALEVAERGRGRRRSRRWLLVGGVVVAAVVPLVVDYPVGGGPRSRDDRLVAPMTMTRIAILPFRITAPFEGSEAVASALTGTIAAHLAEVRSLEVLTGPLAGGGAGVPPAAADLLVDGSIAPVGEQLRVRFLIVDAKTGAVLRAASLERPTQSWQELLNSLPDGIAAALRRQIGRTFQLQQWWMGIADPLLRDLARRAAWSMDEAERLRAAGATGSAREMLSVADSLLAATESRAPGWVEPMLARARVAEVRGWLALSSGAAGAAHAESWRLGIEHAGRALERDPARAVAYEVRGLLRHRMAMLDPAPDDATIDSVRQAEADLRRAVELDPSLARAWSALSSIQQLRGQHAEAKAMAARAYAADAYLEAAAEILARLVSTSIELGEQADADHWCSEIQRLLAGSLAAAWCQLLVEAQRTGDAAAGSDPWAVIAQVRETPTIIDAVRAELEMLAAAVLARRGLRDSAEAVLARVVGRSADPEVIYYEAIARTALGQQERAAELLRRYGELRPLARGFTAASRFGGHGERILEPRPR